MPHGKVMSIGLCELGSDDANTLMESFRLLVNEFADSCQSNDIDKDTKEANLVASITNTMSDQSSVNHVFNADLSEMRSDFFTH